MTQSAAELPPQSAILDKLIALSSKILHGASLEDTLSFIFSEFHDVVPYDRIGFAEIDTEKQTVTARWAKSRRPVRLKTGYTAPLMGSSLALVLEHRKPRVLNDLRTYLQRHPTSRSTELITSEGVRSSMTCPLFIRSKPYAFLFFSSDVVNAYTDVHVKVLKEISNQLALLLMTSMVVHLDGAEPTALRDAATHQASVPLSSLVSGMVVDSPIVLGNGRVFVAAGVELTQQSIARLNLLRTQGFISVDTISVR